MSSFRKQLMITRCDGVPKLQSNGKYTSPNTISVTVNASVQPLKASEMDALPQSRRNCRAVKVYSDKELIIAHQKTGQQADRFVWLGVTYEVVASDAYQCDVIPHYRAYAVEVNSR